MAIKIVLPLAIVSKVDLGRLERELEAVNDFLAQSQIRSPGTPMNLPRTGRLLEELALANNLNLLDEAARNDLKTALSEVKSQAPTIHMSFAADPPASFIQEIIKWLRREIHPQLMLQVGLQPSIAAGCIVRTPNRYFDFSLRRHLLGDRPLLIDQINKAQDASRQ